MIKWKIPLYKITNDNEDVLAVKKVITRGTDWAIGPEIEHFEKLLADYVGVDHCLAFNSGTSALHASLLAIGTREGDEVMVPSFTFIATPNSVLMVNALPRFVDIEQETFGINPDLVERTISKRARALIPVHYAGLPCKIEEIASIAKRKKIYLIEDAAESLGSVVNGKNVGTFGDLSIFSFAGNKVITTGEGGAVVTNSKKIYDKLKLIRSHGRKDSENYFSSTRNADYITIGYNWRMSSITAALAISQLRKIEKLIAMRRNHARYLSSKLKRLQGIVVPKEPVGSKHIYQLYSILLPTSKTRNALMEFLTRKGIMSKVFFYPCHLTSFYKKLSSSKRNSLKITENVSSRILTLPMYPGLQKEELDYIINSIGEFMEQLE
jgi:perosamine synthetase